MLTLFQWLVFVHFFQAAEEKLKDTESRGWKPLTSGIRLDTYSKSTSAKHRRRKTNTTDEATIDIETSDNMPHLSVSKPEGRAIKLDPLDKVRIFPEIIFKQNKEINFVGL